MKRYATNDMYFNSKKETNILTRAIRRFRPRRKKFTIEDLLYRDGRWEPKPREYKMTLYNGREYTFALRGTVHYE